MVRSRPPTRYTTQWGTIGWGGDGGGGGSGDSTVGGGGEGGGGEGGDSVVKAPTALQSLLVSELIALTFQ